MNKIFFVFCALLLVVGCGLQGAVEPQGPATLAPQEKQLTFEEAVKQKQQEMEAKKQQPVQEPETTEPVEKTEPEQEVQEEEPEQEPTFSQTFEGFVIAYTEGDLVTLTPTAQDPDGDALTYTFSEPISAQGTWQTQIGDEGTYVVTVTASDGSLSTDSQVQLIIERANRAPVIDCESKVVLKESAKFFVGDYCAYFDEEDEKLSVAYAGWPGKANYQTTYEDAGEHALIITVKDSEHTTTHTLPIFVQNVNRVPAFPEDFPQRLSGIEGDVFSVDTQDIVDPDGDAVTVSFSEKLDASGAWKSELEDAGVYDVVVSASDGSAVAEQTVTLEVALANTKPTLKAIAPISVKEGETISLPVYATDREGDALEISYSGFMNTREYTTSFTDAGNYEVTVSVTDGEFTTTQTVPITVENVNRPPVFVIVQ